MKLEGEQVLCRVQLSNLVRHGAEPLYQWIVEAARHEDLQGATVLKGFMGLRADGSILEENRWTLTQEVPVIVEVVDGPRHVERLLARVEPSFARARSPWSARTSHSIAAARPTSGGTWRPAATSSPPRKPARHWEVKTMKMPEEGVLLRIFIGESDREKGGDRPLYEAIVYRAREAHLAGATVLKGPMGFGRHSRIHTAKLLELSADLPDRDRDRGRGGEGRRVHARGRRAGHRGPRDP